jgi:general secretion pathway protein J
MTGHHGSRNEDGYTLIELIVVLLLASLIGTAVAGGLQFGTRIWERSQSQVGDSREIATTQAILRSLLASALPRYEGGFVTLHGEPRELSFDAPSPKAFGPKGLVRIELAAETSMNGSSITLNANSLIDKNYRRSVVLTQHLPDIEFSYLDTSAKVPTWLAYWRDRDRLPAAIRLASTGRGGPFWPNLNIELPITQDANCAFDPVSTTCRKS